MEEYNLRKMKYLNIFIMLILVMGFAAPAIALETLGTFKQSEVVRVAQVCQDASYINISSITLPNSTVIYSNIQMTSAGSGEYYFNFINTSQIGRYDVRGISDGCEKTYAVYFTITPAGGIESNTWIFLVLLIVAVGILLLSFLFKNYIFSTIAGFALAAAGVYSMIYGFADITNNFTRMASYTIIGLGMITIVTSALELMNEMYGTDTENNWGGESEEAD
jgi:hypothetical protein